MASTSFITPQHLAMDNNDLARSDDSLPSDIAPMWPPLIPDCDNNNDDNKDYKDNEWELISPSTAGVATAPVVTFDLEAMTQDRPRARNPKILKHSQSSPDLRAWNNMDEESDQEESSSAVLVEYETSMASFGMGMVSGPPSVWSVGSNKLSFKEAILQPPANTQAQTTTGKTQRQVKKAFKTTFVVVKPESTKKASHGMMRNSKSMGNLRALDHIQEDHDVMGETDAGDFYTRKEKGAMARHNGQKQRPDEAKRLQIIMAKKDMQKQRQRG